MTKQHFSLIVPLTLSLVACSSEPQKHLERTNAPIALSQPSLKLVQPELKRAQTIVVQTLKAKSCESTGQSSNTVPLIKELLLKKKTKSIKSYLIFEDAVRNTVDCSNLTAWKQRAIDEFNELSAQDGKRNNI